MTLLAVTALLTITVLRWRRRDRSRPRGSGRWARVAAVAAVLAVQVLLVPSAAAAACDEAPTPQSPGAGLVGALDPVPRGQTSSPYAEYGFAGTVWHTYKAGCGPGAGLVPGVSMDTWLGNELLDGAKAVVSATNAVHYLVLDGDLLGPTYDMVASTTNTVFDTALGEFFSLAALLLAVALFPRIWRGDLPGVGRRAFYGRRRRGLR